MNHSLATFLFATTLAVLLHACTPRRDTAQHSAAPPPLTLDVLANATYHIDHTAADTVALIDGRHDGFPTEHLRVSLLDSMAFGDLDGDSVADAAVLLAVNHGGTGVYVTLAAVLNENGVPIHNASILLGDRVQPQRIDIDDGVVTVYMIAHGPREPMCCPTTHVIRRYALRGKEFYPVTGQAE
jgi:hypothetical protein